MRYSPKSIANYFLNLAAASNQSISPMKLQKLVYYAHGWYAGYTSEPLIDEAVEAWQYGPVIPSLYHEFKRFGAGNISGKATELEGIEFRVAPTPTDPNLCQFLDNIWTSYGQFTGVRLSEMTHAPDGPWDKTWKAMEGTRGADISFASIVEHFKAAIENAKQRSVAT
ncbi:MAG: type II toxin-antitoxin system antitoxin SocA domain-containing protein [Pseudomonadota bacterium]